MRDGVTLLGRATSAARPITQAVWERRHARILWILAGHVPVLATIGLARGLSQAHLALDALGPLLLLLIARWRVLSPRARSTSAALGLMSAAAAFVHLTSGRTESHFLYFVLLGVLALYDDWVPYAVAISFVLLEHGIVGAISPSSVYGTDAGGNPWLWAVVHGGFVLAASAVALLSWRWREDDRAEAEVRLELSEHRFRLTVEAAPIGIALVAPDGSFRVVNAALCELVGYEPELLRGMTFQDITHAEDLEADLAHVRRCLDGTSDGYVMEKRYIHRAGHDVWVQLNVAAVRSSDGTLEHFVSQVLDITERRAAAATQARFAALVEHGSDLISIIDAAGAFSYASPAFASILGYVPEELVGQRASSHVHPDDLQRVAEVVVELLPGQSTTLRFRRSHADGTWRWVDSTLSNWLDDPAVQGIVVNTRDVSVQVEALERLSHQATHDTLTGLANRALLDERLAQAESAAARRGEAVAALFIDIDHFKRVNDACGHGCGDLLLAEVAVRLKGVARAEDTVARIGGDEFVLIATVDGEDAADEVASRVRTTFHAPFILGGGPIVVTASIGVATTLCLDGQVGLLEAADTALYAAKDRGRDCWVRYAPSMCAVSPSAG